MMTATDEMSCQELVELVTDHLEGTLDAATARRFRAHLEQCPACVAYLQQMELTIALTGRVDSASLSPDARRLLLDTFRDWANAPRSTADEGTS